MTLLCVLGLGHIGVPTAALFAEAGLEVVGVDVDAARAEAIARGEAPFREPGLREILRRAVGSGRLRVAAGPEPADAFILAVATPIYPDHRPDLRAVEQAARAVGRVLRTGNLVVLESTVPPGTTGGLVRSCLEEESGLRAGAQFNLAYCPERAMPGASLHEMVHNDRLIGGLEKGSTQAAMGLYGKIARGSLLATDALTAEIAKLAENTYRDLNIALANELARICEPIGANVWDVIALTNRHPRVHIHLPGPGVGGHCLPKDPWLLAASASQQTELIALGRRLNEAQPTRVAQRAQALLEEGRAPHPAKIALLGVAYRGGVDDTRESPALPIARALEQRGHWVVAHDPHAMGAPLPLFPLEEALKEADLLLLVTDHPDFRALSPKTAASLMRTRLLLDTRNLVDHSLWKAEGFRAAILGVGV